MAARRDYLGTLLMRSNHWQAVSIILVERTVKMVVTLTTPKSARR